MVQSIYWPLRAVNVKKHIVGVEINLTLPNPSHVYVIYHIPLHYISRVLEYSNRMP